MRSWLVKDARAHFSDVIDAALGGEPQRVTRRGKGAVVVGGEEEWLKLGSAEDRQPPRSFGEHLARFPLTASEWDEVAPKRHRLRRNPFEDG